MTAIANARAGEAATRWTLSGLAAVALCFVINMADGIDVTILSYIAPRLQADWSIGSEVMGRLFSAGLLGMAIGGMLIAPQADRIGRRPVILAALACMSGGTIASAYAPTVAVLFAMRVLVGIGIGTVLAAMAALAAESAPPHRRDLAVGIVQAGYPFAAIFSGLLVAWLLPVYGWRMMFLGAGLLTVILLPAAWLIIPHRTIPGRGGSGRKLSMLFDAEFRGRTLALWGAVFFGLMVLYFIVSWIPKLAIEAGLSETDGIYAGATYNFGAFAGTALMSLLTVRVRPRVLVPVMLLGAGAAMLVFGGMTMPVAVTLLVALLIGVLLQGGYNGVWPIAASAYPEEIRATAVGWAIGVGRAGAIIGPLMGGYLLAAHVSLFTLFLAYCAPLLACAACAALVRRHSIEEH
ncbi:MFS transporter [Novosphingobium beihaiensis]|uniref:MFS transporter n=1 Tax=Novosphingobium beihaiensis TaxID=2930389 RepID=A0ABT0BVK7_9SPHN|nr:MFS transporter [Novosphingobium beihaiensis]MCJ2189110.1 MFS transporter [Novosphingobium beihaiensis]